MLCLQKQHTNNYLHSDESSGQSVVAIFYKIMVYQHMLDIHCSQTHSDETSGRCVSITVTSLHEKQTVFKNYNVKMQLQSLKNTLILKKKINRNFTQ